MNLINELNKKQKEALLQTEGPVLVIAGAGSGKTKVLTHKIAYIIDEGLARPWEMLAITFTNKAAGEMKERIADLIGGAVEDLWIGTFHSICVRILRRHIDKIGFQNNFVIYDTSEQRTVIKQVMRDLELSKNDYSDRALQSAISLNKNDMITPGENMAKAITPREKTYAEVYDIYQKKLKENNALDFDDIINYTIEILENNEEVLDYYQNKFKYVFVDEYQDTNASQFKLIKLFSGKYNNVTVVGDNDQGIYSFRGADISNILEFEKDYENAKVIMLEQNYRSTQNILNLANSVISEADKNERKFEKKLWTENNKGNSPIIKRVNDEYDEGRFIADTVKKLKIEEGYNNSDFAVLYRMNTQSRAIEDILIREGIPYKIVGGLKFYDRKEIKDAISYLRLIENNNDNVAFIRVINEPRRGIGSMSLNRIYDFSVNSGISMYEVIKNAEKYGLERVAKNVKEFIDIIDYFTSKKDEMSVSEIYENILNKSGYVKSLDKDEKVTAENRIDNLNELLGIILEFEKEEADKSLSNFLSTITLESEVDKLDEEEDKMTLMTLHSSKGLEYPVVFLVGMEEGLFPSNQSIAEDNIEEERRLCYVGVTRAQKRLYLTSAFSRRIFGRTTNNIPSRFIQSIPDDLVEGKEEIETGRIQREYERQNENFFGSGFAYERSGGFRNSSKSILDYDSFNTKRMSNNSKQTANINYKSDKSINAFLNSVDIRSKKIDLSEYKVGVKVMHKKFGKGVITKVKPEEDDLILEIEFEKVGKKRLMAKFAKLSVINE